MKRAPLYITEAEMCTAFCDWARKQGWTPYPEWDGWDILLVAADGTQIGVQAKLQYNLKLLEQTVPNGYEATDARGPDFRAVLLPRYTSESLLNALGISLIYAVSSYLTPTFHPDLTHQGYRAWHYWNPAQRVKLPDYVPDVQPGASGPIQLTEWKIRALRLAAILDLRGNLTRADFKRHGVDPRRWTATDEWLLPGSEPGQFIRGPGLRFAEQHPVVFAQIRAEIEADIARSARGQEERP